MPESKGRKKATYTPERRAQSVDVGNPAWFLPLMLALLVVGLLWVVTYYISGTAEYPVPALGRWNLVVGFAFMLAGFAMTPRWK